MLEGVVLQQTRGDDVQPSHGNAQQHQEDALVHRRQQPDGNQKRRIRGAAKDTSKIYTEAPLKVKKSGITDEEPRKVGGRSEILDRFPGSASWDAILLR